MKLKTNFAKSIFLVASITLLFSIAAGCSQNNQPATPNIPTEPNIPVEPNTPLPQPEPTTNFTGSAEEVLGQILEVLSEAEIHTPMPLPPTVINKEDAGHQLGLSEADFDRLIESVYYSQAAIATFAHQIILIEAVNSQAATEVKNLISSAGGFDPHKWICVFPEKALVIDSDNYVLLVASTAEVADEVLSIFETLAGITGSVKVFWEFADGDIPEGGGLLPGGPIILG
jgi:hypothetical protein